jgi:bilin biosynthesis protein
MSDQFFNQLKHPNPNLREQAMFAIVDHRDETTIPRLMAALDDEDTTYRRAAVKTLGAVGIDTIPVLVEALLTSDNVTVRGSAAKALAQVAINYPEIPFPQLGLDGLRQSLDDANPVVYIASAMALGEIGEPALPILLDVMKTTDNMALQLSIVNALGAVQGDQAAAALEAICSDNAIEGYVKETAISALSRLEFVKKNTWNG